MITNTYETVRKAITEKMQIVAVYQNHRREMCPHVLGTKNGRKQALFYQFGGTSSSGTIVPGLKSNWRCIPIDGLRILEVREGKWHSASNHTKPQSCVDEVDEEVEH